MIAGENLTFLRRIVGCICLIFWVIIGAVVLLIVFSQAAQWNLRAIGNREKAELELVFAQAIADGTVFDPPAHHDSFIVTSRHGNNPYSIWFTNSMSERVGFFVTKSFSSHGVWTFKDLTERQPDFYRSRITNDPSF